MFTKFLIDCARVCNDPSLVFDSSSTHAGHKNTQSAQQRRVSGLHNAYRQTTVSAKKTDVTTDLNSYIVNVICLIHETSSNHSFKDCLKFRGKQFQECKQ